MNFNPSLPGTGHHISGNFRLDIPPAASPDQLEEQIELVGQQFKRLTCQHALQLTEAACEAKLLSSTTVRSIKQEKGRQLEKEQEQWLDNPERIPLVFMPNASPTRVAKDTLQVRLDEVLTDS